MYHIPQTLMDDSDGSLHQQLMDVDRRYLGVERHLPSHQYVAIMKLIGLPSLFLEKQHQIRNHLFV
jgi:hypothetical protein